MSRPVREGTDKGLYGRLDKALRSRGLMARGGLQFAAVADHSLHVPGFKSLVLAGHAGSSFWPQFSRFRRNCRSADPLDAWSRETGEEIESEFGCKAFYPFEKPWWPFQSWIRVAEGLKPSPLAILIHPEYGLWHGYRAAFGFEGTIALPAPVARHHPCDDCLDKPCLSACPANAVSKGGFDLAACRSHLSADEGMRGCMQSGCLARNACPVGNSYRYETAHARFHMDAL